MKNLSNYINESVLTYNIVVSDKNKRIYLDYAATTPTDRDVLEYMLPYFDKKFGNPSSMHTSGRDAQSVITKARIDIAKILCVDEHEILFTGSGTEADNLAIIGVCRAYRHKGNHVIVSSIEHKAILEPAKQLEKEGFVVSILPVDADGKINPQELVGLLRPETILISIMYANNEIGTIQSISELTKSISPYKNNEGMPFFHTDACQALGQLSVEVPSLGVDLMTLNSSKIYGPKGIGLLYKKNKINISPLITGGDQEFNLRAGTENIALVAGFAHAFKKAETLRKTEFIRLKKLQQYFMQKLLEKIPFLRFNGHLQDRLPNNVHCSIPAIEGESIVLMMDREGVEVATGSACSSLDLKPSHVLIAIGQNPEIIHGSVRFSLGRSTTEEELDTVVDIFKKIVDRLISLSSLKI